MLSWLWSVLSLIGVVYLAFVALIFWMQPRLVYFPLSVIETTPEHHGMGYEDVYVETEDGVRLHGWFVPAANARLTVLFLHGNAGNISHRIDSLRIFRDLGLNTFIIDYRGYGRSHGRPTESGTYRDAAAAWRFLTEQRGIAPEAIVVFGRSLGGAVAAWLAEQHRPGGLILESTFSSMPALGADHYPFLPVRWLSRFRYDTVARLKGIDCPVLIAHSRADTIVPYHHAETLLAAAAPPKTLFEMSGGHNDAFLVSGEAYLQALRRFIDEVP